MARGHDHHGVVQLARLAKRVKHAAYLRINVASRATVAARKVTLIAVSKRCAVKGNP